MKTSPLNGRSPFPATLVAAVLLGGAAAATWQQKHRAATSPVPAKSPEKSQPATSPNTRLGSSSGSDAVSHPPTTMPPEPLITQAGKQALINKDGSSLRIELVPGKPGTAVDLQAWTEDQTPDAAGHYDWRFKVTVAAGGLAERAGPADFEAPADGYRQSFEFSMAKDPPDGRWGYTLARSFFVHLGDNTYGLLQVELVAGGAHFVTFRSSVNPLAGSRNLQPPPAPAAMYR